MSALPALPTKVAAFVQGGVSITVAGQDDRLGPSIAKGVGCRVSDARDEITVLLLANVAEAVARDVSRNRQVAVVFSRPSTNRTAQLKGRDARVAPAMPADVALVRRYLALFADDLRLLGSGPEYAHAVFWHDPSHLMTLRFTPEGAFLQTPGPAAGTALAMQARRTP